jgi:hypothetical protein
MKASIALAALICISTALHHFRSAGFASLKQAEVLAQRSFKD